MANRPAEHPLRCTCGRLTGTVATKTVVNRGLCYCRDCQAFAWFLDRANEILDPAGGTEIVQTTPDAVRITSGRDAIACMRLGPSGLLRWYARCCRTPIANTPPNYRVAIVGLIATALSAPAPFSLDASFGPSRMRVHVRSARGTVKPAARGTRRAVARLGGALLGARLRGTYRDTPFFDASGTPVVTPRVLDEVERARLRARLSA